MLLAPSATNSDSILRHSNEVGVGVENSANSVFCFALFIADMIS